MGLRNFVVSSDLSSSIAPTHEKPNQSSNVFLSGMPEHHNCSFSTVHPKPRQYGLTHLPVASTGRPSIRKHAISQMIGSLFARPLREGRAKPCGCNGGLLVVMEAEILARSGERDKLVDRLAPCLDRLKPQRHNLLRTG